MAILGPVNFFAAGGILFAFHESTPAGKAVIAFLLFGSLLSWSVIVTKLLELRVARRQTRRFLFKFRSSRKPLQVFLSRESFAGSPAYAVYVAGCRELCFHLVGNYRLDVSGTRRCCCCC